VADNPAAASVALVAIALLIKVAASATVPATRQPLAPAKWGEMATAEHGILAGRCQPFERKLMNRLQHAELRLAVGPLRIEVEEHIHRPARFNGGVRQRVGDGLRQRLHRGDRLLAHSRSQRPVPGAQRVSTGEDACLSLW
jgi:hypothetical protein